MTASTETVLTAHEWAVEVDTALATLWGARDTAQSQKDSAASAFHFGLDEKAVYQSRFSKSWPTTDRQAYEAYKAKVEAGEINSWDRSSAERSLARYEALLAEIDLLSEVIEETQDAYTGWQRFFMVQNNGGHVHSSMGCPTCNKMGKATSFGWLPDLSGLTEAEAVEAHGPLLCTVCFPSAPVEWTLGKAKAAGCAGTGTYVEPTDKGYRRYALCPVCNEVQARTATGVLRKHKPKESS